MSMQLHHTLMSQYKHGEASGTGSVSYESVANCVTPEVIIYGKCEQKSYTGINLFRSKNNADISETKYGLTLTYKASTGVMSLKGTVTGVSDFTSATVVAFDLIPRNSENIFDKGYATLILEEIDTTAYETDNKHFVAAYGSTTYNKAIVSYSNKVVTCTCSATDYCCGFYASIRLSSADEGKKIDTTFRAMFVAGDTIPPYEPYVGGVASPNPLCPQDIVCNNNTYKCHGYGKNMFHSLNNEDVAVTMYGLTVSYNASTGIIRVYGTVEGVSHLTSTGYIQYEILKQNSERVFDNGYATLYADILSNDIFETSSPFYLTAHTPTKINRMSYFIRKNQTPSYFLFTAEEYACGFNVSIPLQSIDEGKRVDFSFRPIFIEGQHTISDFATGTIITPELYAVGGVRDEYYPLTGKIIRKCKKITLDESMAMTIKKWLDGELGISFTNAVPNSGASEGDTLCTHEDSFNTSFTSLGSLGGHVMNYTGSSTNLIWYGILDYLGMTTVDEFKVWLTAQSDAGTPVTVVYKLSEPVIEYVEPISIASVRGTNAITESGDMTGTQIDAKYLIHS